MTDAESAPRPTFEFDYVACSVCVCGATLADARRSVEKTYVGGAVRFVECARCGTLVQSPRLSTGAVAAWYDSPAYQSARGNDQGSYLDYLAEEAVSMDPRQVRYERGTGGTTTFLAR